MEKRHQEVSQDDQLIATMVADLRLVHPRGLNGKDLDKMVNSNFGSSPPNGIRELLMIRLCQTH